MGTAMPGEKHLATQALFDAEDDPRLATVQAVGAICAILGALGVALLPFTILRFYPGSIAGQFKSSPYSLAQHQVIADSLWLEVSGLIGTGLYLGLMIGALGLLRFRKWARLVLLLWCVLALLVYVPSSYFYARWLAPPWREHLAQVRYDIGPYVSIMGWAIGNVTAVALLVLLNLPHVRRFFKERWEESKS
jgi:hypothetical protein